MADSRFFVHFHVEKKHPMNTFRKFPVIYFSSTFLFDITRHYKYNQQMVPSSRETSRAASSITTLIPSDSLKELLRESLFDSLQKEEQMETKLKEAISGVTEE